MSLFPSDEFFDGKYHELYYDEIKYRKIIRGKHIYDYPDRKYISSYNNYINAKQKNICCVFNGLNYNDCKTCQKEKRKCNFCVEFEKSYNFDDSIDTLIIDREVDLKNIKYPLKLRSLRITNLNNKYIRPNMFPNIHTLTINHCCGYLCEGLFPESLKCLYLAYSSVLTQNMFPRGLYSLDLLKYNGPLCKEMFPRDLSILYLHDYNNPLVKDTLPNNLIILSMYRFNNTIEKGAFPENLEEITLSSFNRHPLFPGLFPKNLIRLILYEYDLEILENSFPDNLRILYMLEYTHELKRKIFPDGLAFISLMCNFTEREIKYLPLCINTLYFMGNNKNISQHISPSHNFILKKHVLIRLKYNHRIIILKILCKRKILFIPDELYDYIYLEFFHIY